MLADILMWLEDNLLLSSGGVVILFIIGSIAISQRRKALAPIRGTSDALSENVSSDSQFHSQQPAVTQQCNLDNSNLEYDPARNHDQARHLIQSIQGDPPRRHFSTLYMFGLFVVAITMLVLPLIYAGIVAAVGYWLYWFATQNTDLLHSTGSVRVNVFVYASPLIVGFVVFIFLFKPLFARSPKRLAPVVLNEAEEPLLFAFVQELCITLKAPRPKVIQVVCEPNAYASFRHGLWSLFRRGDMTLTIGLPFAAGMNLQAFTGVLAHEFGHFTQGTAMRLAAIIHFVNVWFARVVYENDNWDEGMDSMVASSPWYLGAVFIVAKLVVKIGRGILWVLMKFGHAISCFLSRQQEYDADRYEAYISGSYSFGESTRQIIALNVASQGAYRDLGYGIEKMALPDNFIDLCLHIQGQIPSNTLAGITNEIFNAPAGKLDTHPSSTQRTSAVERLNLPGIFHPPPVPATVLFQNMEKLSKDATLRLYQQGLGRLVDQRIMVPFPAFLEKISILKNKRVNSW